jgi:uncharacterized membrane protein YphA (DoxX/SURF4 family)
MSSPLATAARLACAGAWLYEGLYAKVLQGDLRQQATVAEVVGEENAEGATVALGLAETALAAWVLSGRAPRACAAAQTLALAGLAATRLGAATTYAGDPERLVMRNAALAALAWVAAA